jgi:hypothetical protein
MTPSQQVLYCLFDLIKSNMKKLITIFASVLLLSAFRADAQTLVSAEFLGNVSKTQLQLQFFQSFHNGADRYRVTYQTENLDGSSTIASGLICLPDDLNWRYPLACYLHGTSSTNEDVPSNLTFESDIAVAMCGKGYISFAPDYLGLGASVGIHPYVHAASEAWVAVDMLQAAKEFATAQGLAFNEQLFVTGYSQGGHAAMALHKMIDEELSDELAVTAAAPMSGPYSIGEVMRELILSGQEYSRPAYLVNTIISYQYVYGDLFNSFDEAFKPEYLDLVDQYWSEQIGLGELNDAMVELLTQNEGGSFPLKCLRDDYIQQFVNDPNHPANLRMQENNTYDFAPTAPTRLIYCAADDQVPYENSITAEDFMLTIGATDVESVNLSSFADHSFCAILAIPDMLSFFSNYQKIEPLTNAGVMEQEVSLQVFPNPATDVIRLGAVWNAGRIRVFDSWGRCVLDKETMPGVQPEIRVEGLENGIYWLQLQQEGRTSHQKLTIQRQG